MNLTRPMPTFRAVSLVAGALVCSLVGLSVGHAAGPLTRHTTVFLETVDGHSSPHSEVETALVANLLAEGLVFVDEIQARKIRSVTEAGQLVAGGELPDVVTPLDADVIIAGVVELAPLESGLLVRSMSSYAARGDLRLLAVDTGRILGVVSGTETAVGLNPSQARAAAARSLAAVLGPRIREFLARSGSARSVQLTIRGAKSHSAREQVRSVLEGLPGVEALVVHQSGAEAYRLSLATALDAADLAGAIENEPGLGLKIVSHTPLDIRAEFSARRASARRSKREPSPELVIEGVQSDDVFPSLLGAYAERPLASVRLRNGGRSTLRDVRVAAQVLGLSAGAVESTPVELSPGATVELPVRVVLDVEKIRAQSGSRPGVLEIRVRHRAGPARREQTRSVGVRVHDSHSLSWSEPNALATFVAAQSATVVELARAVQGAMAEIGRDHPMAIAAAAVHVLGGLRYSYDPSAAANSGALDYVQYPAETLAVGGGDCDDLAVLTAALIEASGRRALLVGAPGHVLVAVGLGVPSRNALLFSLEPDRLLHHDGQLWLPLETTALSEGFIAAWQTGANEVRRAGQSRVIVDLRTAWQSHPPADLARPGLKSISVDRARLLAAVSADLRAVVARHGAEIRTALSAIGDHGAASAVRRGTLHVAAGEFDRARILFEAAAHERSQEGGPLNNLGNLELMLGNFPRADDHYALALKLEPDNPHIHLNTAIGAWLEGDDTRFGDHILACVSAGGEDLVRELQRAGLEQRSGPLGDRPGRASVMRLEDALSALLRPKGPIAAHPSPRPAARRVTADGEPRALARYLYWL